jgi:hypothetical protein
MTISGRACLQGFPQAGQVAEVGEVGVQAGGDPGGGEEAGLGRGGEGVAGDPGAKLLQPEAEPTALEARVAGDEDAPATPEGGVWIQRLHGAQTCQGAVPLAQSCSRKVRSRRVSMGCQKPG